MYQTVYEASLKRARHRVWIFSDLQQKEPAYAEECLRISMEDFRDMGKPADRIWYLGDCAEGKDRAKLDAMCRMQEQALLRTGLPVCAAMGNHDLDLERYGEHHGEEICIPFYDMAKRHPHWQVADTPQSPWFRSEVGGYAVYFFSDHVAADRSWVTTHGQIHGDESSYPFGEWERLREIMAGETRPIITASHYAFPGGSRPSPLLERLMPLPHGARIHFYGHAHIGDLSWAGNRPYQRISWMEEQDVPQVNVSSFEHIRGLHCRSVFLHIYEDGGMGIFFRNHDKREFTECYFPAKDKLPAREAPVYGAERTKL